MKVITVYQPNATLIVMGVKTIETKTGPPAGSLRPPGVKPIPRSGIEPGERIAIHAAAKKPRIPSTYGPWTVDEHPAYGLYVDEMDGLGLEFTLPLGAIVGTVTMVTAVPIVECSDRAPHICDTAGALLLHSALDEPWRPDGTTEIDVTYQHPLGDFTPGRWGLILADPEPCAPVPIRGHQGVWTWDP